MRERLLESASCGRFFLEHDELTAPGRLGSLDAVLPDDAAALRAIVSELITHAAWAAAENSGPPPSRETLPVAERLMQIQSLAPGTLGYPRALEPRPFGTCRDFFADAVQHAAPQIGPGARALRLRGLFHVRPL